MAPQVKSSRRASGERGAALVEFALILPVFMMLILGMFSGGLAYNKKITMTDAVREGSRYGATLLIDVSIAPGDFPTWETKVKQRVAQLSAGELSESQVCARLVKSGSGDPNNCGVGDPSNSAGEWVARVSATRNAKLEAFFFTHDLELTSKAAAFYERAEG